jgi:flagellar protein FlbD
MASGFAMHPASPFRERYMILVTRLDRSQFYLNAELIQSVESRPDTHIVRVNGHSFVVREPETQVVDLVMQYRRSAYGGVPRPQLTLVTDGAE